MDLDRLLTLIRDGESERVEFKRAPSRTIHREIAALTNAEGGHIIIGVDDSSNIVGTDVKAALEMVTSALSSIVPPPQITTRKLSVNDRDLLIIEVQKGTSLCSVGGVVYIRVGTSIRPLSIQEILMLSSELGIIAWDGAPATDLADADPHCIDWFFEAITRSRGKVIADEDRNRYLRSAGAVRDGMLTNAGILFFTDAGMQIPHAKIRMIRMANDEPVWSREFEGPVARVIEAVYSALLAEIQKVEVVVGARRVRVEEYPPRAIREAIINAVAHRNYTVSADIRVFLHPDRIDIRNPGGLMPGVDIEDPEHVPRNPALSNLLYDAGFIERYGYGIRLIRREVEEHPFCSVAFSTGPNRFGVTFRKMVGSLVDEVDRRILDAVREPRRSGEIALVVGLSRPTVLRRLKTLEGLGLIRKEGAGAHVRYAAIR